MFPFAVLIGKNNNLMDHRMTIRTMVNLSGFSLLMLLSCVQIAWAQGDANCEAMQRNGLQLAEIAREEITNYDQKAEKYNTNIRKADQIALAGGPISEVWDDMLIERDSLVLAGEQSQSYLKKLYDFNQLYTSTGCISASSKSIQEEYELSISPFKKNIAILKQLPDDWRDRYQTPAREGEDVQCEALAKLSATEDSRGADWANRYDPVIKQYDQIYNMLAKSGDTGSSEYLENVKALLSIRDEAMIGVQGYPEILQAMYQVTLQRVQTGCLNMSEIQKTTYQKQHQEILSEIAMKLQEMKAVEAVFQPTTDEVLFAPGAEVNGAGVTSSNDHQVAGKIMLTNNSSHILCVNDGSSEPLCNFFSGQSKTIDASKVILFGGGYWNNDQNYQGMTVCRIFYPSEKLQKVTNGLDNQCQPSK